MRCHAVKAGPGLVDHCGTERMGPSKSYARSPTEVFSKRCTGGTVNICQLQVVKDPRLKASQISDGKTPEQSICLVKLGVNPEHGRIEIIFGDGAGYVVIPEEGSRDPLQPSVCIRQRVQSHDSCADRVQAIGINNRVRNAAPECGQ